MKYDLGIRAGKLLSMKGGLGDVQDDYFIGVVKGEIVVVTAFRNSFADECTQFIDGEDQLVIPGLINGHTHLAMSLFRGFEDDLPFHEWLFNRIFPIEAAAVDEEFVRVGTELSAMECIRFGTTTVNDMYFYPQVTAEVLDRSGLRAIVAQPFIDFVIPDEKHLGEEAISSRPKRFEAFYEKYKNHPRIQPALGPHAPYTDSDELLRLIGELSDKYSVPVHMHVCETKGEVEHSLDKYQKKPVKRLYDLGVLGPHFIAAHCVHLDDEEVALFKKSGASMVYNPDSNLKLSSGIMPLPKYKKAGIRVGLGTDGAASNNDLSMFGAMDIGTKIQKVSQHHNTAMVALDAIRLATYDGAHALGMQDQIGSIEVGKRADIVLLDTHHPHTQPLYSVLSQLVYAYQGLEVNTVVCDGQVLLGNGEFKTLEPSRIRKDVEGVRLKVVSALQSLQK